MTGAVMIDYTSDLPIDPQQFEAIGMVAAEWSYLESVMDVATWSCAGIADEDVGATVTMHLAFRPRLDMLATLFDLDCQSRLACGEFSADDANRQRDAFREIRNAIISLQAERNAVVHARWIRDDRGSPLTYVVTARGTLKRSRLGRSVGEMRAIAHQIAEQAKRLQTLVAIEEESPDLEDGPP